MDLTGSSKKQDGYQPSTIVTSFLLIGNSYVTWTMRCNLSRHRCNTIPSTHHCRPTQPHEYRRLIGRVQICSNSITCRKRMKMANTSKHTQFPRSGDLYHTILKCLAQLMYINHQLVEDSMRVQTCKNGSRLYVL